LFFSFINLIILNFYKEKKLFLIRGLFEIKNSAINKKKIIQKKKKNEIKIKINTKKNK
jgi:hypothetical protein